MAGCGVCHTDLGFFYDGVPTRHAVPADARATRSAAPSSRPAPGAEAWLGRDVVVPAVIPCGACDACRAGRGSICPKQVFPGQRRRTAASPRTCACRRAACARCPISRTAQRTRRASTSPRSRSSPTPCRRPTRRSCAAASAAGDLAVFVGVGGVGGFGVQIAAALGAPVVAIDVEPGAARRASRSYGADARPARRSARLQGASRQALRDFAKQHDVPSLRARRSSRPRGRRPARPRPSACSARAATWASSASRPSRSSCGSRT